MNEAGRGSSRPRIGKPVAAPSSRFRSDGKYWGSDDYIDSGAEETLSDGGT
jgi:hypothetical protein